MTRVSSIGKHVKIINGNEHILFKFDSQYMASKAKNEIAKTTSVREALSVINKYNGKKVDLSHYIERVRY